MRIDITRGAKRGWLPSFALYCVGKYIGRVPGPMLFMTYDLKQFPRSLLNYMLRSTARRGSFSKCERELFATFVSHLNTCHF